MPILSKEHPGTMRHFFTGIIAYFWFFILNFFLSNRHPGKEVSMTG